MIQTVHKKSDMMEANRERSFKQEVVSSVKCRKKVSYKIKPETIILYNNSMTFTNSFIRVKDLKNIKTWIFVHSPHRYSTRNKKFYV